MSTVLVVDDDESLREYIQLLLTRAGHTAHVCATRDEALAALRGPLSPQLVISDFRIGNQSGFDVLAAAKAMVPSPEVIIITAYGTPASAIEAMRKGAYDYISKPFDNDEFVLLVEKALEKYRILAENEQLRERVDTVDVVRSSSPSMKAVWAMVDKVGPTKSTVLISGESGTGKEIVARALHNRGAKTGRPFLPVNCAAIAEGVLESELFGHVKGAFTGAVSDRVGLLVDAGEGTIFLDEVGEMPLGLQAKLLRVLQERKVKPVGSSREVVFGARIVAATNRSLEKEVAAGRFREDLLFRLNVIAIELPPLRARTEDIVALAQHFLSKCRADLGRPMLSFAPAALAALQRMPLHGNVRQLQNIVERAATLTDDNIITPELFATPSKPHGRELAPVDLSAGFSLDQYMDAIERGLLTKALDQAQGVKTRAAQLLGMSFRSFRYRLAKHDMADDGPT